MGLPWTSTPREARSWVDPAGAALGAAALSSNKQRAMCRGGSGLCRGCWGQLARVGSRSRAGGGYSRRLRGRLPRWAHDDGRRQSCVGSGREEGKRPCANSVAVRGLRAGGAHGAGGVCMCGCTSSTQVCAVRSTTWHCERGASHRAEALRCGVRQRGGQACPVSYPAHGQTVAARRRASDCLCTAARTSQHQPAPASTRPSQHQTSTQFRPPTDRLPPAPSPVHPR